MNHQHALPVLSIRNAVLFPHVAMQIAIDRAPSLAAVEAALATEDQLIAVFSQHDPRIESPQRFLIITGGPTYSLPGGGSCSVAGDPSPRSHVTTAPRS